MQTTADSRPLTTEQHMPADAQALAPLLVGYDGSPGARRAIEHSARVFGARPAIVATVWHPHLGGHGPSALFGTRSSDATLLPRLAARADRVAAEGAALAAELGFDATPLTLQAAGGVAGALTDAAAANDAGAIVLGTGVGAGSRVVTGVVRDAPVPVVASGGARPGRGPLVIGYDGSADARLAIEAAAALSPGAHAIVVTGWERLDVLAVLRQAGSPAFWADCVEIARNHDEREGDEAAAVAEGGAELACTLGLRARGLARPYRTSPAEMLARAADGVDAAALVVGVSSRHATPWHRRAWRKAGRATDRPLVIARAAGNSLRLRRQALAGAAAARR